MRLLKIAVAVVMLAAGVAVAFLAKSGVFDSAPWSMSGQVAIGGYDPVAFFTLDAAIPGDPAIAHDWAGATWHFSSVGHRDAFRMAPQRYAPRYGGYCAYAVALGYRAHGDPRYFSVVDDALFLNFDESTQATWLASQAGLIASADVHWADVMASATPARDPKAIQE